MRPRGGDKPKVVEAGDVEMSEERALVATGSEAQQASSASTPPQTVVLPNTTTSTAESQQIHQLTPLGDAPMLDFTSIIANLPATPITADSIAVNLVQNHLYAQDPAVD